MGSIMPESQVASSAAADWMTWATVANAIGTLVLMFITGVYAWIAHRQLRAGKDPILVVTANPSEFGGESLNLVLINLGGGTAYDVSVQPSRPWKKYDPEGKSSNVESGAFVHGVAVLPQGAMRSMQWGTIQQIKSDLGAAPLRFAVRYRIAPNAWSWESRDFPIEVGSLDGDRFNEMPLPSIALSLRIMNSHQEETLKLARIQTELMLRANPHLIEPKPAKEDEKPAIKPEKQKTAK